MDPLSVASSVFGVVSLALQLASTIQQMVEFWDSVKEAPEEVEKIKSRLRCLGALLQSVQDGMTQNSRDLPIGIECLQVCKESVAKLEKAQLELERGLNGSGIRRRWTRLKKAMRDREIKTYEDEIETAKTMLIIYQGCRNGERLDFMLATLRDMTRANQRLPVINHDDFGKLDTQNQAHFENDGFTRLSLGCNTYEVVLSFGTIRIRVANHLLHRQGQRLSYPEMIKRKRHRRLSASFIPNYPLLVLDWSFHQGFGPLKMSLQSFNMRPDGTKIFRACYYGDISAVQKLIEEGTASPHDVDPGGLTPLHHAAVMHRAETCKLLIKLGAKPDAVTERLQTPLMMAADGIEFYSRTDGKHQPLNSKSQLDTIRILVERGLNDPMEVDDVGYNALLRAAGTTGSLSLSWLLNQDIYEIDLQYKAPNGNTAHAHVAEEENMDPSLLAHFLRNGMDINAPCANWWYSPCASWWYQNNKAMLHGPSMLQYCLWGWYDRLVGENDQIFRLSSWPDRSSGSPLETIRLLLDNGADIHARSTSGHTVLDGLLLNFVQFDGYARPPDVLVRTISTYLSLLQDLGISLPDYIRCEEAMHRGISYDLGIGLYMKTRYNSNNNLCVSATFQGLEEREKGEFMDHVTQCAVWERWRETYTAPKPPLRNIQAKYLPSPAAIVIRAGSYAVSEELPESTHFQNSEQSIFKVRHAFRQRASIFRAAKHRLISSSKYRLEFSIYVLLISSLFDFGYFTRFWFTAMFYVSLKLVENVVF